ncbi:MAG: hypothetical protein ACT4TC_16780 [Myxococcaceae bacterium]
MGALTGTPTTRGAYAAMLREILRTPAGREAVEAELKSAPRDFAKIVGVVATDREMMGTRILANSEFARKRGAGALPGETAWQSAAASENPHKATP